MLKNLNLLTFMKELSFYVGGSFIAQCISMFAFPLWVAFLSPADFGTVALLQTFQLIFTSATNLNLITVLGLNYVHLERRQRKQLLSSILLVYACCFLTGFLSLYLVLPFIQSFIFQGNIPHSLLLWSAGISAGTFLRSLLFQLLRFAERASYLTTLHLVENISYVALNVFFIGYLGAKAGGVLCAQALSLLFVLLIHLYKEGILNLVSPLPLRPILKEGINLFPLALGTHLLHIGDRLVLAQWTSLHVIGIYSFASKFSQIFHSLLIVPLQRAYLPFIQKAYRHDYRSALHTNRSLLMLYLGSGLMSVSCAYFIGKPLLLLLIPHAYHSALQYIALLLVATIISGGTTVFAGSFLRYTKNIRPLATILVCVGTLNIVLNISSVQKFGVLGCTVSTVFTSVAYLALTWYTHQRVVAQTIVPAAVKPFHHHSKKAPTHENTSPH